MGKVGMDSKNGKLIAIVGTKSGKLKTLG